MAVRLPYRHTHHLLRLLFCSLYFVSTKHQLVSFSFQILTQQQHSSYDFSYEEQNRNGETFKRILNFKKKPRSSDKKQLKLKRN